MPLKLLLLAVFSLIFIPGQVFARVTPEGTRQAKRAFFESSLSNINDPLKRQRIEQADQLLKDINLKICAGFDADIAKMAAILDEEKSRQGVTQTVGAYGRGDTPLDTAAYYINYAAEAVAYQKIQDYTPQIKEGSLKANFNFNLNTLVSDLKTVQEKILRAKTETKKALNYYEK